MKIHITGIASLLGSNLARALIARGDDVVGNDNLICGSKHNVPPECTWWQDDCCNTELFSKLIEQEKPDVIFHAAATAAEGLSVFSPSFITRNIAEASVSVFSAAAAHGVKRVVYCSSMARYGKGQPPFKEDHKVGPCDPYGIAKVYAELQLRILAKAHGFKWAILVPHNVVGVGQEITPYRNVATIFLNCLKLAKPIYIYGDGEQKRCFSPVADIVPSLVAAVDGKADGEVVNIGPDNEEITISQLVKMCEEVTGKKAEKIHLPPRPLTDNIKNAYCSSDKARRLLGYKEVQDLFDCLQEMSGALVPVPFPYKFPVEITRGCPRTWTERLY